MSGDVERGHSTGSRAALRLLAGAALLLVLSACGLGESLAALPTAPPTSAPAVTFAPVVTMTRRPPPTHIAVQGGAEGCNTPASRTIARYDVDAEIDPLRHSASASMKATYRNATGRTLDRIVMNIDASRTKGLFTLESLTSDTPLEDHTLDGARLEIPLKSALKPGCTVTFDLRFSVKVLPLADARMRYLAYTERQLNLGYWLPEFAPFVGGAWRTPKSWSVGEYIYSDMADFEVRAALKTGLPDTEIIGPGEMERINDTTWTFTLREARSFTLAVSNQMARLNTRTDGGVLIDLFYFPKSQPQGTIDGVPVDAPRHALQTARQAVERYTQLFGPLPYNRIVVVEADFPDGMEFSGLVYVSQQWFTAYRGKPDTWLTLITAHEIAHQWWYVLITSDQGETPYLDEALAIYCEMLYLEGTQPDLVPWWWTFRVKVRQPRGYVDANIYEYWVFRAYVDAVYLRGASMLQEIRDVIGSEAFFKWLQDYADAGRWRIVTATDFWEAMGRVNYLRTSEIRLKYMRNPDPLNDPLLKQPAVLASPTVSAARDR